MQMYFPSNKVQYAFMRHTFELQFCMGSDTILEGISLIFTECLSPFIGLPLIKNVSLLKIVYAIMSRV